MIHIEGNFYIDADERNYILKEDMGRKDKDGAEIFIARGFYGTIKSAITAYYMQKARIYTRDTESTLPQAISALSDLSVELEKTIFRIEEPGDE